jgi:hypothetical protein
MNIATLPKHRKKDWEIAIDKANRSAIQGNVRMLDCHIVWDLINGIYSFDTVKTKIAAGDVPRKKLFKELKASVCKKSDATFLVIIGEMINGCWIIGKTKNYWLTNHPVS